MGSNNPVPSRAAIHALRGLVFGTSCSVVLIAEERRRRLKTVRAAAENARKIHAAKSHRGASDLAWEARLLHRNEEALATMGDSPSPRNFRRTQPDKRRTRMLEHSSNGASGAADTTGGGYKNHKAERSAVATSANKEYGIPSAGRADDHSAVDQGLGAWIHAISGGDVQVLPSMMRGAKTRPGPLSGNVDRPTFTPPLRNTSTSKVRSQLAAFSSESPLLEKRTQPPHGPFTHPSQEDCKGMASFLTAVEPHPPLTADRDAVTANEPAVAAEDGMARWEARVGSPTVISPRRKPRARKLPSHSLKNSINEQALVHAGDGLALWDRAAAVKKFEVTKAESYDATPSFSEPLPRLHGWHKSEVATKPQQARQSYAESSQYPPKILQTHMPSYEAEKVAWRSLFKRDESGRFQPTFDPAELGEVAPQFIKRFKRFGIAANPYHRWLHGCLLLERLLMAYQEGGDAELVPIIHSMLRALESVRSEAPETLRQRPHEVSLAFLQRSVQDKTGKRLSEHISLLLPDSLDPTEILSGFVGWAVKSKQIDAFRQLFDVLQQKEMNSIWKDGTLLSSLLRQSAQAFVSPRGLFSMLREIGLAGENLPLPVLAEFGKHIVTVTAVIRHDAIALELLDKLKDQGLTQNNGWIIQAIVVRDARHCSAAEILAGMERIKATPDGDSWLTTWRSQLISIFVASNEPIENEAFLRGAHAIAPFPMEEAWVQQILNHHSESGALDQFLDWLGFSIRSGFQFDQDSFHDFLNLLTNRWRFTPRNIHHVRAAAKPFLGRGIGSTKRNDPQILATEDETFSHMVRNCRDKNWDATIRLYEEYSSTNSIFSSRCLGLAITACLNRDGPPSQTARELLRQEHAKGHDARNETARLLTASFLDTSDPEKALAAASDQGFDIPASVFNSVARTLAGELKSPFKALRVCERWAAVHGDGRLGFDEKHFSTLVRVYVLLNSSPAYAALGELIHGFIARPRWWHRGELCKETIKYQQKWIRQRTEKWDLTEAALHSLDLALEHIAHQRARCGNPDWIAGKIVDILTSPQGLTVDDPGVAATVRRLESQASCRLPLTGRSSWPLQVNEHMPHNMVIDSKAAAISVEPSTNMQQNLVSERPVLEILKEPAGVARWQQTYHETALGEDGAEFEVGNMSHSSGVLA